MCNFKIQPVSFSLSKLTDVPTECGGYHRHMTTREGQLYAGQVLIPSTRVVLTKEALFTALHKRASANCSDVQCSPLPPHSKAQNEQCFTEVHDIYPTEPTPIPHSATHPPLLHSVGEIAGDKPRPSRTSTSLPTQVTMTQLEASGSVLLQQCTIKAENGYCNTKDMFTIYGNTKL